MTSTQRYVFGVRTSESGVSWVYYSDFQEKRENIYKKIYKWQTALVAKQQWLVAGACGCVIEELGSGYVISVSLCEFNYYF